MADNGKIEGLPEGAEVTPLKQPAIEGLPEGAEVTPIGSTESVQPPVSPEQELPKPPEQPGFWERAYETSGIKGLVDQAKAKHAEETATRDAIAAAFKSGDYGTMAEAALHHIAHSAGHAAITPIGEAALNEGQRIIGKVKDTVKSVKEGDVGGALENSAAAVPLLGGIGETIGKPLGTDIGTKNYKGIAGDVAGAGAQYALAKGMDKTAGISEEPSLPAKTATAEETAPKALPLKEAGERVQAEAKGVRDVKGKAVGAAKEKVAQSLPKEDTSGPQTIVKTEQPIAKLPLPKDGALAKVSKAVLDDTADTEQLAGAKDQDISEVRDMAEHLSKGQNAKGEPLSADPARADSIKRAFDQKIATLEGKVAQGGNATALKHVKALKTAFNDDLFDSYEKYGDPNAAKALRSANKDYAQTVAEQTQGPAKTSLKTQSPEKVISNIVSGGAKSQSAVESLLKNSSKEGNEVLRDSTLKEIYRQTSAKTADGNIDMNAARQKFNALGDAGKKLFGEKYEETKQFLDAAAKEQIKKNAEAGKPSVGKKIASKLLKAGAAGAGAELAGVPGAIAAYSLADSATDAVFQTGKSGAVKIGISPTERIVLSPADAASKRPLITKFLNAKSAGKTAAMTSAYNAITGKKTDDGVESAIDNSDGSKESQDDIFQKVIAFNKASKTMDEDTKARIQKKITDYNNSLVRKNYK